MRNFTPVFLHDIVTVTYGLFKLFVRISPRVRVVIWKILTDTNAVLDRMFSHDFFDSIDGTCLKLYISGITKEPAMDMVR